MLLLPPNLPHLFLLALFGFILAATALFLKLSINHLVTLQPFIEQSADARANQRG